jgi:hypothetical protein
MWRGRTAEHPAARTIEEVIDARVGSPQGGFRIQVSGAEAGLFDQ